MTFSIFNRIKKPNAKPKSDVDIEYLIIVSHNVIAFRAVGAEAGSWGCRGQITKTTKKLPFTSWYLKCLYSKNMGRGAIEPPSSVGPVEDKYEYGLFSFFKGHYKKKSCLLQFGSYGFNVALCFFFTSSWT